MADFYIQYEGTKFSFTVYNENNEPMSYEFLIRKDAGDPKWKWIYLPYGEKSIKVKDWSVPCEPVPSFNTENGIELSFIAIFEGKKYEIKACGTFPKAFFPDKFVADVFKNAIECITNNTINTIEGKNQTINFSYDDAYEEKNKNIELQITSNPL